MARSVTRQAVVYSDHVQAPANHRDHCKPDGVRAAYGDVGAELYVVGRFISKMAGCASVCSPLLDRQNFVVQERPQQNRRLLVHRDSSNSANDERTRRTAAALARRVYRLLDV
jgi:hypothetical protein